MIRRLGLVTLLVVLSMTRTASAQSPSPVPAAGSAGFVDALTRVPASMWLADQPISYLDYRAMERSRAGAARPASFAALKVLVKVDHPAARLWLAAAGGLGGVGLGARSDGLLRDLFPHGAWWPELLGFDFFDVDREVAFGQAPFPSVALMGRFDPGAVSEAFLARGYDAWKAGDRTLLCGPTGCGDGPAQHLQPQDVDPRNPFGGALGRTEPLAVGDHDVLESSDEQTLRGMLAAVSDPSHALAAEPDIQLAVSAIDPQARLIQATLLPGALLRSLSVAAAGRLTPEESAAFVPIPRYRSMVVADGSTDAEQVVDLILVYANEADAEVAAAAMPERLSSFQSVVLDQPLGELLTERGVTSIKSRTVRGTDGAAAAVVTLRAPLASADPDPSTGRLAFSSGVYQQLVGLITTRELLWLVADLG